VRLEEPEASTEQLRLVSPKALVAATNYRCVLDAERDELRPDARNKPVPTRRALEQAASLQGASGNGDATKVPS